MGRRLPYRRAAGGCPAKPTALLDQVVNRGWAVDFGAWGREYLGDFLLGMAVVRGLSEACSLADGETPEVVYYGPRTRLMELYARYSYGKWITGSYRHHALAAALSQMLALSDADLWLDGLDGDLWGPSGSLTSIPPEAVADFAGSVAGWW